MSASGPCPATVPSMNVDDVFASVGDDTRSARLSTGSHSALWRPRGLLLGARLLWAQHGGCCLASIGNS